ncbi:FAD-dependent monooxygenase [Arthrobacter sp. YN]|uniref:FAD-dependent monooxygenase n=1 Tax=Arthrobacter sp. YN TaxID=2020486 RepID=UPI0012FDA3DB|nr:FAD-dependent monooxygenase [Arthrobacter sp. YN]
MVAGAGPVGLTLALFLARAGRTVTVLEREAGPNEAPRAMVYLHSLLPDLAGIGMLDPMRGVGYEDHEGLNLHLASTGELISIPNTALEGEVDYPFNVHLGQGEYCRLAIAQLMDMPNVRLRFNSEVTGFADSKDGVSVQVAGEDDVTARYLVGSDGGQSLVRKQLGATLEGFTWTDRFVATNVRFPFESMGFFGSNMYVHPEIACIISRINSDGLWRVTYQEPESLPVETVEDRIPEHFHKLTGGRDVDVVSFNPYRMHQRLSTKLRSGNVILAGDAAHLTNPTGGLGLTTGLYDVVLLQETLRAVLDGADEDALDYYEAERSRVFREVTSPNASSLKTLLYESSTPELLEQHIAPIRQLAGTESGQRQFLHGLDAMRSPALTAAAR